jgi:hypothetical protein
MKNARVAPRKIGANWEGRKYVPTPDKPVMCRRCLTRTLEFEHVHVPDGKGNVDAWAICGVCLRLPNHGEWLAKRVQDRLKLASAQGGQTGDAAEHGSSTEVLSEPGDIRVCAGGKHRASDGGGATPERGLSNRRGSTGGDGPGVGAVRRGKDSARSA